MAKYTALNSTGRITDFVAKSDIEAIIRAYKENFKCLIKVRSFLKSSPVYTLLDWKEEGH